MTKLGPAYFAATPINTKIPVPIMAPMPKRIRSNQLNDFFNACFSLFVS